MKMKKLRLELDDMRVESFVTGEDKTMRGTVKGKAHTFNRTYEDTCWNMGCTSGITAPDYCPSSMEETCNGHAGCPGTSEGGGYTCDNTCSDYGCTVCYAWC